MTESSTARTADPAAHAVPPWTSWADVRPLVLRAAVFLGLGVAVGIAWSRLVPVANDWSENETEQLFSGEVVMAVLGIAVGVVVAVAVLVRPGRHPVAGISVTLLGSGVGSLVAWGVGRALGAPELHATGVLVLWPLSAAAVTALVTLLQVLLRPDGP